jgi:glycosyltransferase involved in cell wall biosynthesis
MSLKASVIIPTYNNCSILQKNIDSILNQSIPLSEYEVIVVDDGSTDSTSEIFEKYDSNNLKYIKKEHSGRAKARNSGIVASSGEIIIFIDSDVIPCKNFVEAHINAHGENSGFIVRGITINVKSPESDPNRFSLQYFSNASFPTGNCSVQRKHLIKAGLFDEDFTEYGWEDLELGHRLMNPGLKKKRAKAATGIHIHTPLTITNLPFKIQKESERGRMAVLYCKKSPIMRTKISTSNLLPFFLLARIINIGDWVNHPATDKLLHRLYELNIHIFFRFIAQIKLISAYFKGMKEKL